MGGGRMCYEDRPLTLISGDLFSLDVELDGTDGTGIQAVWFTSKTLGLQKALTCIRKDPASQKIWYRLYLSSEETERFPSGSALYDLTVEYGNEDFMTAQYNGSIIIQKKINEVVGIE